jgi:hypothetical protein
MTRKIRFAADADVAVLKLTDTYDVTQRRLFQEQKGWPVSPDERALERQSDGALVEIIEEVWDEQTWRYGSPMVRVQSSRTGDVFLVYCDEIHSVELDTPDS